MAAKPLSIRGRTCILDSTALRSGSSVRPAARLLHSAAQPRHVQPRACTTAEFLTEESTSGRDFAVSSSFDEASASLSSIAASFDESLASRRHDSGNVGLAGQNGASLALADPWRGIKDAAAPFRQAWAFYNHSLEANPMVTKGVTSFFGFIMGDILAQRIGGGSVNLVRTARLSTYGLFIDGPVGHLWYKVLDKYVKPDDPRGTAAVLLKTAADQLIWAPVMTCIFFAVLKTLEGHPELIQATIQDKLLKTIVANYVLWPAAHFINFRFVPTEHRILYNNAVSVVWNAYLSTLSNAPSIDTEQLLNLIDNADTLLDGFVPETIQDQMAAALSKAFQGLPPGLSQGLPRRIPVNPTRVLDWLHIDL